LRRCQFRHIGLVGKHGALMGRRGIEPWAASLLALLPLAAVGASAATAEGLYAAPSGPLILTRTLRRPLPDGAEIVSTRRYELRIVADDGGFRVDGKLIAAEVDAPPALAPLAAIERNRPDTGLFPFRLDPRGMIISPAAPTDRSASETAAESAKLTIASSTLSSPDIAQATTMIDQLVARPGARGARWPADLFRPDAGLRSETSHFELPDGQQGSVTTTTDARRAIGSSSIERTVITETGGSQRVTRETFTINSKPD